MKRALQLTLPSGVIARVKARAVGATRADDRRADDTFEGTSTFGGRALTVLLERDLDVSLDDGEGGAPLDRSRLMAMPLCDYHVLRDLAFRLGVIDEVDEVGTCRNCDAPLSSQRDVLPVDDLAQWYTRDAEPIPSPLPLPHPIDAGDEFELAPVAVGQALPLWRMLVAADDRPLTASVVAGLGLEAIGNERRVEALVRLLEDADDVTWAAIETAFLHTNYSMFSYYPHLCGSCGAVHDVEAPAYREFPVDPQAERLLFGGAIHDGGEHFPDEDTFATWVQEIGREVYRQRSVANIELETDVGTPPVDDGGEPLLGSYEPLGDELIARPNPFLISIYYQTFRKMWEEAPFDVRAEIRETIDHEVEHHLYFLDGYDPMDEAERAEAFQDLKRTFGEQAVNKAQRRWLWTELSTFGWFLLGAVAIVAAIIVALSLLGRL